MALILTRSPYLVSRDDLDEGAQLTLEIGDYNADTIGFEVEKTIVFNYRNAYYLDVSPFLKDYLGRSYSYSTSSGAYTSDRSTRKQVLRYCRMTLSGELSGVSQADVVTEFFFTSGYLYSTDDFNYDFSSDLEANAYYAGSSDIVYKLENSNIELPVLRTTPTLIAGGSSEVDVSVVFYNKGEEVNVSTLTLTPDYSEFNAGEVDWGGFVEWGAQDGIIDEETRCSERFLKENPRFVADKAIVSANGVAKVIDIVTIPECKYNPYRIKFRNRYGVNEYLWFFKKSVKSISVNKESYRGNSIQSYSAGDGVKTYNHFNVNGRETLVMNSDWVDERMNESFKQMMISENLELYDFDKKKTYNINVVSEELQFKTHVNDKLINYEITVEFAHEVINNVG